MTPHTIHIPSHPLHSLGRQKGNLPVSALVLGEWAAGAGGEGPGLVLGILQVLKEHFQSINVFIYTVI